MSSINTVNTEQSNTGRDNLGVYLFLPIIIMNLTSVILVAGYIVSAAINGQPPPETFPPQLSFALFASVTVIEWVFILLLIFQMRRRGQSLQSLITPQGNLWKFKSGPAFFSFAALNLLFGLYMAYSWRRGMLEPYTGFRVWQTAFLLIITPITAGFVEEVIWRGYIITRLEARGRSARAAVILSAVSFSLIHGIFLPLRLLVTFLWGMVAGFYVIRERHLLPLIITHIFIDIWAFALSFLLA